MNVSHAIIYILENYCEKGNEKPRLHSIIVPEKRQYGILQFTYFVEYVHELIKFW